jgi:glycosyltransferase involved in cell wall biosynthesis
MKIVILCTQLEGGGAQRAAFKLANEINNRNFQCENWFLYKKRNNYSNNGIVRIIMDKTPKTFLDYFKISFNYFILLKKTKPDAVITFTHYANVLGLIIAYFAKIKIRVASHRNPSWGDMSKKLIFVDNFLARSRIYTSITAVSKSTKESFSYYPEDIYNSIKVINNGFDIVKKASSKADSRKLLGFPLQSKIIGNIGRLSFQKNQAFLIKIISEMKDICLVIAGEGEERENLQNLADNLNCSDRIFLIGELNYDLIPEFLNSIDLFTMPSLYEGLSNALVEAMANGLPIIASDVPSQRDVLVNNEGIATGMLLDPKDDLVWKKAIEEMFNNSEKMNYYSELSFKRSKDFSIENMCNSFINILNNING